MEVVIRFAAAILLFHALAPLAAGQAPPFLAPSCVAGVTAECLFDEAIVVARRIDPVSDRIVRLREIAFSQFYSGFREAAQRTLEVADRTAQDTPNLPSRPYVFLRISELYVRIGDTPRARASVSAAVAAAGDDPNPALRMAGFGALEQAKLGDFEGAWASAKGARAAAEKIADPIRRTIQLEQVAALFLKLGDFDQASVIRDPMKRAFELGFAAMFLASIGDREKVGRATEIALRTLEETQRTEVSGSVLVRFMVATARFRVGDIAGSRRMVETISPAAMAYMSADTRELLAILMLDLDLARALSYADSLQPDEAWRIYSAAASKMFDAGDDTGALRMAERVVPHERARILCLAAVNLRKRGRSVTTVLARAEAAATDDTRLRAQNMSRVARTYAELGMLKEGRAMIARYGHEALEGEGFAMRGWIALMLTVGDREGVARLARALSDDAKKEDATTAGRASRARTLIRAAATYGFIGDLASARTAAMSIDIDDLRASALASAAASFVDGAMFRR